MAVKVLELHHHGIRVGPTPEHAEQGPHLLPRRAGTDPRSRTPRDPRRPRATGWIWATRQIHLMGVSGPSKYAKGERQDPTLDPCGTGGAGRPGDQARAGPARRQILDVGRRSGAAHSNRSSWTTRSVI